MDELINLIVVIISQCISIANYHIVYFKYIAILFVNYTSIKLEGEGERETYLMPPWLNVPWPRQSLLP